MKTRTEIRIEMTEKNLQKEYIEKKVIKRLTKNK
jgi:hypothetical protein